MSLTFPNLAGIQEYSGEIHFYSPVEKRRDLTVKIKLETNYNQIVDLKNLERGRYQIKIDWKAGNTSYYQEEEISIE